MKLTLHKKAIGFFLTNVLPKPTLLESQRYPEWKGGSRCAQPVSGCRHTEWPLPVSVGQWVICHQQ